MGVFSSWRDSLRSLPTQCPCVVLGDRDKNTAKTWNWLRPTLGRIRPRRSSPAAPVRAASRLFRVNRLWAGALPPRRSWVIREVAPMIVVKDGYVQVGHVDLAISVQIQPVVVTTRARSARRGRRDIGPTTGFGVGLRLWEH